MAVPNPYPIYFQNHRVFRVSGISPFLAECACIKLYNIVLTHTTFVKFGLVISHHCKEFNSWSHTTEMWEQLYTKLCRSFDIVHHFAHIISSFQEICSLVTNLCTFVTIFLSLRFKHYFDIVWGWKFTSGNCFAFIVNAYGKQIICSIWYSKFDV